MALHFTDRSISFAFYYILLHIYTSYLLIVVAYVIIKYHIYGMQLKPF